MYVAQNHYHYAYITFNTVTLGLWDHVKHCINAFELLAMDPPTPPPGYQHPSSHHISHLNSPIKDDISEAY